MKNDLSIRPIHHQREAALAKATSRMGNALSRKYRELCGVFRRRGSRGIIQINSRPIQNRQRFSLAHELDHWELHPNLQQKFCTALDMRDYI